MDLPTGLKELVVVIGGVSLDEPVLAPLVSGAISHFLFRDLSQGEKCGDFDDTILVVVLASPPETARRPSAAALLVCSHLAVLLISPLGPCNDITQLAQSILVGFRVLELLLMLELLVVRLHH